MFRTHLPSEVLVYRLAQEIEVGPFGSPDKALRGRIDAWGFDVVPILRGRVNTWRPRALGSIRVLSSGETLLDVTMRLGLFATAFMGFFFGFVLLMVAVVVLLSAYNDWALGPLLIAVWPMLLAMGGYVMMMRAFSSEVSRLEQRFAATCVDPPAGPAYR